MPERAGGHPPQLPDEPVVSLHLLGSFSLHVDGAPPVTLPVGAQHLVALLALRGRTGRSRLAGLLWPDTVEQRALACLRTGIWRVNQAAHGLVVSARGVVELGPMADVDTDRLIERSRAVLGAGTGTDALSDPVAEPIADPPADLLGALTDVEGDLLPDWDDPWLDAERERLRQLRLHVLEATARRLTALGRYGLALEAALAAVRADELRESAHRSVIEIHLAEGNVVEARRAYAACARSLRDELGVEPTGTTRALLVL
ncbi:SARP family transcriptional regulator [Cellulosimicrobium terreum]|nr:SARP family transcriptional regulator [Cellulosimicrobium terreum]